MESFENELVKFEFEDGVLIATFKAGLKIGLPEAKNIVTNRTKLLDGRIVPYLILDQGVLGMEKTARDYFSSDEGITGLSAAAFIEESVFSRMLFVFFVKITKPKLTIKVFTDKKEALTWLQQFKEE